jgi:PAS domain S-box-containing protein
LEVLLTGLPDSVFIKDREGRFLLANQMVAHWMGNSPTSLRGQRDVDVYTPEMAIAFRKDEEEVMSSGMPMVNREERVVTPDGRELYLLTTKLPYIDRAGEIVGIIGISRNVTLRHGFDEQMKLVQAENTALREQVAEMAAMRIELARLTAAAAIRTPLTQAS